LVNPTELAN